MTAGRLRAPAVDGGLLIDPAPSGHTGLIARNSDLLRSWDYDFQGRTASRLRASTRREILVQSKAFLDRHGLSGAKVDLDSFLASGQPLIVTGHQPELFHPGVWIKNFAAAAIARAHGGLALNLIVDSDIPKSTAIQAPAQFGQNLRSVRVEFDRWGADAPFEDSPVLDEARFDAFADSVLATSGDVLSDPVLTEFWPRVLARRHDARTHGLRFALARRELEGNWGVANLEVPMSTVCQTDGFLWFVAHILAQLPRYCDVHNATLAEYRTAHGIRSKNHPVAALSWDGEWREAPFWVWRAGRPRRQALLARQRAREIDLRIAGEDEVLLTLPLTPDREACCAVERLRELAGRSVRLRTRALTTTVFARFLLGELFLHGIGGAKYDELGDLVSQRFLGIEPPGFLTVSMTLRLPLRVAAPADLGLTEINRHLRDLEHNPDRHLTEPLPDEARRIVEAKRSAVGAPVTSSAERKSRRLTIRRCNQGLQPWVEEERVSLVRRRANVQITQRALRAARSREYSFVLHSISRLQHAFAGAAKASWGVDLFGGSGLSGGPRAGPP
jgi:hypothetical protein